MADPAHYWPSYSAGMQGEPTMASNVPSFTAGMHGEPTIADLRGHRTEQGRNSSPCPSRAVGMHVEPTMLDLRGHRTDHSLSSSRGPHAHCNSYAAGIQVEPTMADLRGHRTDHGLHSTHCLPPAPVMPRDPWAPGHAGPMAQEAQRAAWLGPHRQAPLPSLPMTSFDPALRPRRTEQTPAGPVPPEAGWRGISPQPSLQRSASMFSVSPIGVLPCRPLFPEDCGSEPQTTVAGGTPPAPRPPAGTLRPTEASNVPPKHGLTNQFKDSSSYLDSISPEYGEDADPASAAAAATESERNRRRDVRKRNCSPSNRLPFCWMPIAIC